MVPLKFDVIILLSFVCFAGFIFLSSILSLDVWLINGHSCSKTIENDEKTFNCSYKNLFIDVPQDLETDLTVLDLSGNTMYRIFESSFQKYYQLKVLLMKNMERASNFTFGPWAFKSVYSIEILDITNISQFLSTEFKAWPPNVREIHASLNGYSRLHLTPLKRLEKLFAHHLTNMNEFPDFNPLTPILVIDLKNNPIKNLTTEILAGLCRLEHLNLSSDVFSDGSYCECLKFDRWMKMYEIKEGTPFDCLSQTTDENCDLQFDETLEMKRRNCFATYVNSHTMANWYLVIPLVLIILFSLLIPSYLYMKNYRNLHHKKHHHIFSRHKTHQSPREIGTPTNDEEVEDETASITPASGEFSPENVEP